MRRTAFSTATRSPTSSRATNFVDAYTRLVAMKLFSRRAVDYFRSASLDDRRYLLFNPMTKAKVTMEGETVLRALHDVIAAKGYEKNTMFREVSQLIGTLPRLEGTVHVNVGLVLKFMPNYMLNPKDYPEIPSRNDAADDTFFWNQGPTRGAGKVQFADWAPGTSNTSAFRTLRCSTSRPRHSVTCCSPPHPMPNNRRTSTSCSTSGICSH